MVENAVHGFMPNEVKIDPSHTDMTRMIADFFDRYFY